MRVYEIRPRRDQSGFDLISDALSSVRLSYEKAMDAIAYAKTHCRSHDALILVYDESGNVIEIVAGFVGTEYESEGEWRWNRLHF